MKRKSILFLLLMVGTCNALVAQSLTTKKVYYDQWGLHLQSQWTELRDGSYHGTFKYYSEKGKLEESREYDHGKITSCTYYFQDGSKQLVGKVTGPYDDGRTYNYWPLNSYYFTTFTQYKGHGGVSKSYSLKGVSSKEHCDLQHPNSFIVESYSSNEEDENGNTKVEKYTYLSNGVAEYNRSGNETLRFKNDLKNKKLAIVSFSKVVEYNGQDYYHLNAGDWVKMAAKMDFNGSTLTIKPAERGKKGGFFYKGKLYEIDNTITCNALSKAKNYELDMFTWDRCYLLHFIWGGSRYITYDYFNELLIDDNVINNIPVLDFLEIPESILQKLNCIGMRVKSGNQKWIVVPKSTKGNETVWNNTDKGHGDISLTLSNDEVISYTLHKDGKEIINAKVAKGTLVNGILEVELIEGKITMGDTTYNGKFENKIFIEGTKEFKYDGADCYEKGTFKNGQLVGEGIRTKTSSKHDFSGYDRNKSTSDVVQEKGIFENGVLVKGRIEGNNFYEEGTFKEGDLYSGVRTKLEEIGSDDDQKITTTHNYLNGTLINSETTQIINYEDGSICNISGAFKYVEDAFWRGSAYVSNFQLVSGDLEFQSAGARDLSIPKGLFNSIPLHVKNFKCIVPSNHIYMEKRNGDVFEGVIPDKLLLSILGENIESTSSVKVIKGKYTTAQGNMLEGTFKKRDILYKGLDPRLHISGSADFATEFGRYIGGYAACKAEGEGKIIINDLGELTGTFAGDKISKDAVCTVDFKLPTGDTFKGQMLGGKAHGHCELRFANGDYYIGKFENGKFSGTGDVRYTHSKGVYEGKVKDFVCQYDTPQGKKALKKIKAPKMPKITLPSKVGKMM